MKQTVIRVELPEKMTLRNLAPPTWDTDLNEVVITKIYAGGTRLDEGWKYSWDGIHKMIPPMIPRKNKGRNLQSMIVMVNMEDRMTIETILAYYTGWDCVEYGIFVKG